MNLNFKKAHFTHGFSAETWRSACQQLAFFFVLFHLIFSGGAVWPRCPHRTAAARSLVARSRALDRTGGVGAVNVPCLMALSLGLNWGTARSPSGCHPTRTRQPPATTWSRAGTQGTLFLLHPADLSGPPTEELRQALPVWLLLWTMSTLGPMHIIPQTSHFSLPLGSRMPPAPDKALLPWPLWEPFIFSPAASSTRKSSAHSSPFSSQARAFSSSL